MSIKSSNKRPLLLLSLLLGPGALAATASCAIAKTAETESGASHVVLETHSVRDLGHGYAVARAFVYGQQGVRAAMSMAVDGCGQDHGHIAMSLHPADIDVYAWRAGGTHFYDRLAVTACKNR